MRYKVYKLSYLTQAGWPHVYIGYTGDADWRKVWHKVKPNAWNQYRAEDSELAWVELEQTHDKSVALALEAFHAARAVAAEPASSRGGPWSRPTLTKAMLQEARLASGMTLAAMFAYARDNPEGGLGRHLKDLSYEPSRNLGRGMWREGWPWCGKENQAHRAAAATSLARARSRGRY